MNENVCLGVEFSSKRIQLIFNCTKCFGTESLHKTKIYIKIFI